MEIFKTDVKYESSSVIDEVGRVFHWNNRIFREIRSPEYWELYNNFLKSDSSRIAFEKGIIETNIPSDLFFEDKTRILEHKKIQYVSYPNEWTLRMLWDAALMIIDCIEILDKENLMLKDCHPWNVLFNYSYPKWIDFGSIVTKSSSNSWFFEEFNIYFILPLWFNKFGGKLGNRIAYKIISETRINRELHGFSKIFPLGYHLLLSIYMKKYLNKKLYSGNDYFFKIFKRYLFSLKPKDVKEEWAKYYQSEDKKEIIIKILKNYKSSSILDIAANKGEYSFEAEKLGWHVIAFDREEHCVNQIYSISKKNNLKILPLRMDFIYPTAQFGVGLGYKSSYDRLQCDVILFLGLFHHLVLHQKININIICNILSHYSSKIIIFEYVSPEDIHIKNWKILPDYSKESLIKEMKQINFELSNEVKYTETRDILVFQKNNA